MSGYVGQQERTDTASDYMAQSFLVQMLINRMATVSLVQVVSAASPGGLAPVGFVDVRIMVNQVDGAGNPTPHGTIHNVPFFRVQGGMDAVVIDPKPGDIGIALFCHRDITGVKRTRAPANPGSDRLYDYADALYIGGVLNGTPLQYVLFAAGGITMHSPTKITLSAPNIEIDGDIATTGALLNNTHDVGSTHRHNASGGTGIGGTPV